VSRSADSAEPFPAAFPADTATGTTDAA
jgi:hypothetical protein